MLDFFKKVLKPKPVESKAGKVDKNDVVDIVKVSLLVAIATGLETAIEHLGASEAIGPYKPFVILGLTAGLDFLNKLMRSKKEEE